MAQTGRRTMRRLRTIEIRQEEAEWLKQEEEQCEGLEQQK